MDVIYLLTRWDVPIVFVAVLLEQSGLPLPAAPVLVAAGALAATDVMRPDLALLAAFVAALIADHTWFFVGRRYGRRLLGAICRWSLSPDTCVRSTDDLIGRYGAALLLVAKFIPGVSAVAIPTAAANGLGYRRFIVFDALGCLLWSGTYLGAGVIFSREITRLLDAMSWVGSGSAIAFAAIFAIYIGAKVMHRRSLRRLHRLVRITPDEVAQLLLGDDEFVIVDARSSLSRVEDPRVLPRSIAHDETGPIDTILHGRREQTIITFCTCPNEASAALLAERLIRAGHARVRVLTGGTTALEVLSIHAKGTHE